MPAPFSGVRKKTVLLADYQTLAVSEARFRLIAELAPVMRWPRPGGVRVDPRATRPIKRR
jgi:hypothetical protein